MYKLTSLIKHYFITSYILTNLIFFSTCIYFIWWLYLKILFYYSLNIYFNELKFIYSNDLIFKRINSNITQHQIPLQKANGICCNFFKLLNSYVTFRKSSSQKANKNSFWKGVFLSSNSSFKQLCNQTPI